MRVIYRVCLPVLLIFVMCAIYARADVLIHKQFKMGKATTTVLITEFFTYSLEDFIRVTYDLGEGDTLRIISQGHGGNAFVCMAMINHIEMLKRRGVHIITEIQSMALSANAYIWLTGDVRVVHQHDLFMTHHAAPKDRFGNKVDIETLPPDQQMIVNLLKVYIRNKLIEILKNIRTVNEMLDDKNNFYTGFELFQLRVATTLIYN